MLVNNINWLLEIRLESFNGTFKVSDLAYSSFTVNVVLMLSSPNPIPWKTHKFQIWNRLGYGFKSLEMHCFISTVRVYIIDKSLHPINIPMTSIKTKTKIQKATDQNEFSELDAQNLCVYSISCEAHPCSSSLQLSGHFSSHNPVFHPQIHKLLLPHAIASQWWSPLVALRKPIRAVMLEACAIDSGQYGCLARERISNVVCICVSCGQSGDPCAQRQHTNWVRLIKNPSSRTALVRSHTCSALWGLSRCWGQYKNLCLCVRED